MGVEVLTGTAVQDYDGRKAILRDGQTIPTSLLIWAAGVRGNVPPGIDPNLVNGSRIQVDEVCRIPGSGNVFVLGDLALYRDEAFPKGVPQLANVAIAEAAHLAGNFRRVAKGQRMEPFAFRYQGAMATVGRNKAVVDLNTPRISFQGLVAWLVWMSVHLYLLMGFKNRILVFINWAYKYITFDNSLRLIYTRPPYPIHREEDEEMVTQPSEYK
jgi:NADH dehydrogenase